MPEIPLKKDFNGRKQAWREAQDTYFLEVRSGTSPATLDDYAKSIGKSRSHAWKNLWKKNDRAEDADLCKEGCEVKILERKVRAIKKRKANPSLEKNKQVTYAVPSKMLDDSEKANPKRRIEDLENQEAALHIAKRWRLSTPQSPDTATWPLRLPQDLLGMVGTWFAEQQDKRTCKEHWILIGDVWVTGYGGYEASLRAANHNQKAVRHPVSNSPACTSIADAAT
jgi:hypothetical protein